MRDTVTGRSAPALPWRRCSAALWPDVVAVVEAVGSPAEQAARAEAGAGGAAEVAEMIVAQGVAPGRVRLETRTERGVIEREIRVYVR